MVKLFAPSLRAIARAARTATGLPSTANHAPCRLGGSPATKVIMGCALPVCTPRSARADIAWLLNAPLACKITGGSCACPASVRETSSTAASGTASHKRSQRKLGIPQCERRQHPPSAPARLPCVWRCEAARVMISRDSEALRMEQLRKAAGERSGANKGDGFHLFHDSRVARQASSICV